MPVAIDHVFAFVLAVLFPVRAGLYGYRRLAHAAPEDVPRVRLSLYRQAIVIQWALTIACLALWAWHGRAWGTLGVVPRFEWPLLVVALAFAMLVGYVLRQRCAALEDEDTMARLRDQMRSLERMLPRSEQELRWFVWLSITAGICEEILYRGYLIWYFDAWLPIVPALAVAGVIFGFGHAYQGPRGILLTTMVGLVLGAVFLFTGSLWMGVVIHALLDVYSGHMARAAFTRAPAVDAVAAPVSEQGSMAAPASTPAPHDAASPPAVDPPPEAGKPLDASYPRPGRVTADDLEG